MTGAAGFVGFHLTQRLLRSGIEVLGVDDLDTFYDVALKRARLAELAPMAHFRFHELDLADAPALAELMRAFRPNVVVHLAARAGVRNPTGDLRAYAHSNLDGFVSVLDACRQVPPAHLLYASSSSVYGANSAIPFREDDPCDRPSSFYAATKRSNEMMAEAVSGLEGIAMTGLRFFTLYGPWGRPDMAYYSFARRITAGEPITLHDAGVMQRDFTFIDDAVEAICRLMERPPVRGETSSGTPHRIYNIGHSEPVALVRFVDTLERALGRAAIRLHQPMQPGEVPLTYADTTRLREATGFAPTIGIEEGLAAFVEWFRQYHGR